MTLKPDQNYLYGKPNKNWGFKHFHGNFSREILSIRRNDNLSKASDLGLKHKSSNDFQFYLFLPPC